MSFDAFRDKYGIFLNDKLHSYVLTVYSNGVHKGLQFFLIFCK